MKKNHKLFFFMLALLMLLHACESEKSTASDITKAADLTDVNSTLCNGASTTSSTILPEPLSAQPRPNYCGSIIKTDTTLTFSSTATTLEIGSSSNNSALTPDSWSTGSSFTFTSAGTITLFVRPVGSTQSNEIYNRRYTVVDSYPPAATTTSSDAINMSSPTITAWATDFSNYLPGDNSSTSWQKCEQALGQAQGNSSHIVSLGDGGSIILTFENVLSNHTGADFAIFENSFSDQFLELAYVEVSSDGSNFVRFDTHSLTDAAITGFGVLEPEKIYGFAGRYRQGFGTPFDLSELNHHYLVQKGTVDLEAIRFIRIVDVASGDGITAIVTDFDSFNNPIYDPYPTAESGGFDLDAVAIIGAN